jgi:hypothetical protein
MWNQSLREAHHTQIKVVSPRKHAHHMHYGTRAGVRIGPKEGRHYVYAILLFYLAIHSPHFFFAARQACSSGEA